MLHPNDCLNRMYDSSGIGENYRFSTFKGHQLPKEITEGQYNTLKYKTFIEHH